jgi:ribose transport system permease protein
MNNKILANKRKEIHGTNVLQKILPFVSLVLLIVIFSLASPNFLSMNNLSGILISTAVTGVLAIAVTFVIISGGIDLSIGTLMSFTSIITAVIIVWWKLPVLIGVIGGILVGALVGFFNGIAVVKMKIPPFVATLGMMMIVRGLSLVITDAAPIYFTDIPVFQEISLGNIYGFFVKNGVLIFFALAIIAHFVLSKTILGRYTFAIGGNREAARLSGVKVDLWNSSVYVLTGGIVGVAGVLMASRLNSANPALGFGYELDAIAAAVIGGASLSGGRGTIVGSVIGAFIMSVLLNGLRMLSVPPEWQIVLSGAIIIGAVFIDQLRMRRG